MDPERVRDFEHDARGVYREVFKALSWPALIIGAILLLSLHFIGTTIHNHVHNVLHVPEGWVALTLAVLIGFLFYLVKRNQPRFEVELREARHRACEALILPLSRIGEAESLVRELLKSTSPASLADQAVLERFGSFSWRIPLESIAAQMKQADPALKVVVVLSSPQSRQHQDLFSDLIGKLCADKLEVVHITSLGPDLQHGVDFCDPALLSEALVKINALLAGKGIPDSQVMFDVTAGTSLVSVLCTAAAYRKGRRIQYVLGIPGQPYKIRIWEPVYLGPGALRKD